MRDYKMNFEEWHEEQTHKAYQSLDCPHYAWEKVAWSAAIEQNTKANAELVKALREAAREIMIHSGIPVERVCDFEAIADKWEVKDEL